MSRDVVIAYLHQDTVSHSFMESLFAVQGWDREHGQRLALKIQAFCPSGRLAVSRNRIVRSFLDLGPDWLWMIDTDMGFTADTLDRLLASADPVLRPVVGALCFGLRDAGTDGLNGHNWESFATVYGEDFAPVTDFPADSLLRAHGTGAACLLVHWGVLETIGDDWFTETAGPDGLLMSEDLSFCSRLGDHGIPVHVDTGVRTSHHKSVWISS